MHRTAQAPLDKHIDQAYFGIYRCYLQSKVSLDKHISQADLGLYHCCLHLQSPLDKFLNQPTLNSHIAVCINDLVSSSTPVIVEWTCVRRFCWFSTPALWCACRMPQLRPMMQ
ncbi:unnamed protein product [Cercospora beticola]|nr:unnamed protein product [Cercospora beticola]